MRDTPKEQPIRIIDRQSRTIGWRSPRPAGWHAHVPRLRVPKLNMSWRVLVLIELGVLIGVLLAALAVRR
jgi:hypothetical protein